MNTQAIEQLREAYEDYIKLLTDELNDLCSMAYVHGWRSNRVKEGEEAREKIVKAKELLASLPTAQPTEVAPLWYREDLVEQWIKKAVEETTNGILEFIEKDTIVKDKEGNIILNSVLSLNDNPTPLTERIYPRLKKHGIVFNIDQNPEPSVATGDAQSDAADNQNNPQKQY